MERRELLEDPEHEVHFSAATIWEVAIKAGLGRADFAVRSEEVARGAVQAGFVELPVHAEAAARVVNLPPYHRDPCDRLLVAQAMAGVMSSCKVHSNVGAASQVGALGQLTVPGSIPSRPPRTF